MKSVLVDENKKLIIEAYHRIQGYILNTPLIKNEYLSQKLNNNIYIKYENLQISGSFKLRGSSNKILQLKKEGCTKVVTASTGNHALGVATICAKVNMKCEIFVPKTCNQSKLDKIKLYGKDNVKLNILDTTDCGVCEKEAIKFSSKNQIPYVSPYNDINIVLGQGTLGYEIHEELNKQKIKIDEIYVSVGGGGLISGIGFFFQDDGCKVIGVQPVNSPIMYYSVKEGRILDPEKDGVLDIETWSDGTAGSLDENSITLELCKQLVHEWVLVNEDSIQEELINFLKNEQIIIEGAAGLAIAGAIQRISENKIQNKNICIVLCGRNMGINNLKKLIS